jgi:hypothetical protein
MVSSAYFHNNNRFAPDLSINEHKLMLDVGIVEKNKILEGFTSEIKQKYR